MIDLQACSNCWICEGWTDVRFEWTPGLSSDDIIKDDLPFFLHLEIDNYEPDLMMLDRLKPGTYIST
jgi:NLR family CARD domain-containing protein 3